jgi:GNAT superfamily N-acetyltransferase
MSVAVGTLADWPQFARWHYRSHHVGSVRFVTVLRHGERPVGICVFSTPPLSLAARNRFFGRSGTWTRLTIGSLNRQLATISRVVLHPTYRGAGLAAAFVRQSCRICPYPWIEALAQMGRINPFFEKAGFTPIESSTNRRVRPAVRSPVHGVPLRRVGRRRVQESPARNDVSRGGEPTYYIFDNRESMRANASVATSTPRRLRPTSI